MLPILLSAFCQSFYQLLSKESANKYIFLVLIFLVSNFCAALFIPFIWLALINVPAWIVACSVLSGIFFASWHILIGFSYSKGGDLSIVYPLASTGVLYLPLFEYVTRGTTFSTSRYIGIGVVMIGVFVIQKRPGRGGGAKTAHQTLPLLTAALAGFVYACGAYFDKAVVTTVGVLPGTVLTNFTTLAAQAIPLVTRHSLSTIKAQFRLHPKIHLAGGLLLFVSTFGYRYALQTMSVSHAVAIRQTSSVFSVILGVLFLKEQSGPTRFLGAAIIVSGVWLLSY